MISGCSPADFLPVQRKDFRIFPRTVRKPGFSTRCPCEVPVSSHLFHPSRFRHFRRQRPETPSRFFRHARPAFIFPPRHHPFASIAGYTDRNAPDRKIRPVRPLIFQPDCPSRPTQKTTRPSGISILPNRSPAFRTSRWKKTRNFLRKPSPSDFWATKPDTD